MKASAREHPAYITALLKELDVTDKHISNLEAQLEVARAAREGIKRQVDAYAITPSPIHQLPRELFLEIFRKWDGDQAKRNATLLFVCKAWNQLVTKAPEMWTDIRIECNRVLDLPMHFSYAEACVHRSAGLLLDISIRFIWMPDDTNKIYEDLLENATKDVNHAVRIARAYQKQTARFSPLAPNVGTMMRFLLRILTGDDQMHMDRWRGFALYTDTVNQETELWNSMTGPTSNLLTLSCDFNGSPMYPVYPMFPMYPDKWSATLGFPKLKAMVTNLCLGHENTGHSFMRHAASLFTALVKLELGLGYYGEMPTTQVYVPRLQALRVKVTIHAPFMSCFDAPNLSYLELSGSIGQTFPRSEIFTRIKTFVWSASAPEDTGPLCSVLVQTILLVNLSVTIEQKTMEDNVRREIMDTKGTEGGLSHLKLVKYAWSSMPVDGQSSEKVGLSLDTDPRDWDEVRIIEGNRQGDFWL